MTALLTPVSLAATILVAGSAYAPPAHAQLLAEGTSRPFVPLVTVAVDCDAAARRAAEATGGRVLAARPSGAGSCEVTLLVPNDGGRPRRVVLNVPA